MCDRVFHGTRDYVCHLVHSADPTHRSCNVYSTLCVCNVCYWCGRVFADIPSTKQHINQSVERGYCPTNRGFENPQPAEPETMICPTYKLHPQHEVVCSFEAETIEDLNNSLFSAVTYHELYRIAARAALDEESARKRRSAVSIAVAQRIRSNKNSK